MSWSTSTPDDATQRESSTTLMPPRPPAEPPQRPRWRNPVLVPAGILFAGVVVAAVLVLVGTSGRHLTPAQELRAINLSGGDLPGYHKVVEKPPLWGGDNSLTFCLGPYAAPVAGAVAGSSPEFANDKLGRTVSSQVVIAPSDQAAIKQLAIFNTPRYHECLSQQYTNNKQLGPGTYSLPATESIPGLSGHDDGRLAYRITQQVETKRGDATLGTDLIAHRVGRIVVEVETTYIDSFPLAQEQELIGLMRAEALAVPH